MRGQTYQMASSPPLAAAARYLKSFLNVVVLVIVAVPFRVKADHILGYTNGAYPPTAEYEEQD
jgi:hypothetical protein